MKATLVYFSAMLIAMTSGCSDMGQVIQGRVIGYDRGNGIITFLEDTGTANGDSQYSIFPPAVFSIPSDPRAMGPAPASGLRTRLDVDKNTIQYYDPVTKRIQSVIYTPIEQKDFIDRDNSLVKGICFPVVNHKAKTITLYSKRQKRLVTFTLQDDYFNLPENTWAAGDDIRIYYKQKGKALRMMNITQTDIFKK